MVATDSPMVIEDRLVQLEKAEFPIVVTPLPIVTEVRPEQSLKALFGIACIASPITTVSRLLERTADTISAGQL